MSAFERLRAETRGLWKKLVNHPFPQKIADGSLEIENYLFYMKQDYVYLIEYSRVLAVATARMTKYDEMVHFAELLYGTLSMEMELHRRTCEQLGIKREELEKVEPAMITISYTSYLIRLAYNASVEELIAGLLPCEWGYYEIGRSLKGKRPENKFYRDWIETYSSDEFAKLAMYLRDLFNRILDPHQIDGGITSAFKTSLRFEVLFFEMAMRKETWSDVVI